MTALGSGSADHALGKILRDMRLRRSMSQLDLALTAEISQRHLGFVELGRSRPSPALLTKLLDALEATPAERAATFLNAGFAVPEGTQAEARRRQNHALLALTRQYEGMPIIMFDHTWTTIEINTAGMRLGQYLMPSLDWANISPAGAGLDMIAATAHAGGLLSHARDPARLACTLLSRFEADRWSEPRMAERVEMCAAQLRERYGDIVEYSAQDIGVPLDLTFDTPGGSLAFVAMQCLVAAPQDVSLQMPRVELWLPCDDVTRRYLAAPA